ncbi:hypothetical protein ES689_01595 [Frigoribacterium sp. ACAM 257]|uniref:hypothetical protein n=1 Tax=Frigoribacterium sp. ACAM 257 TaxID=2508998 RepID=UPI0011B953E6|nr:hypothetical protein [Frigoribacterium sp. ACAM 257]TWX40191.1 hypothetical protein ES689_01595 [Frigoribacterium sp. ACAM 257]
MTRRSPQQVDPLGALSSRPVTALAAVAAVVYATVSIVVTRDEIVVPAAAVGALVALGAAGVVLVLASSPLRAPLTRWSVAGVVALGALAAVLAAVASAGHNSMVRDDWASLAVGLLLAGLAPYRPALDLVVAGLASAVVLTAVVLVESEAFLTDVPVLVFVVVAVTPVLALSLAGASFSAAFTTMVERWIAGASSARQASADEFRSSVARSVQQDRVTILNRDVAPFFGEVVAAGVVTEADVERARRISADLRSTMVAEADRSWLEQVLADPSTRVSGAVVDVGRAADRMTAAHRTSLRALLVALGESDAVQPDAVRIELEVGHGAEEERVEARISVATASSESAVRHRLAPYFAVVRIVFDDLQVDPAPPLLTLRFSYDQH